MGISSKDHRGITEGATRVDFGGHKCPPTGRKRTRELSRQNRDTQWKGWRGGREKRKSPPRKKPPTKKEKPLLAAPLAYGRLRRPPLSLLSPSCLFLWRLRRHLTLSSRLSLASPLPPSYGGCAAPLLRSLSSPASSAPLAAVGGCAAPLCLLFASLSPLLGLFRGSASRRRPLLPAYLLEAKNTQKRRHMS